MFRFSRRVVCLSVMIMLLSCLASWAAMIVSLGGDWPGNWPDELEVYRDNAKTCLLAAGSQANIYHIPFAGPAEFKRMWPILLKLKSKALE